MERNLMDKKKINIVCDARLDKYFKITKEALEMAKKATRRKGMESEAADFLDMAERYFLDAEHFRKQGNYVTAFAALNYAHGWLDAGARIQLFKVSDSRLFTVDDSASQ
jgi:uncharacterized protein